MNATATTHDPMIPHTIVLEMKAAWERGDKDRFDPYGNRYAKIFREQE